jgi:hypothetical protein
MIVQATIGIDYKGLTALIGCSAAIIGVLAVNAFWFSAGMLYEWRSAKVIRIFWIAYVLSPVLVWGAYRLSVYRNPPSTAGSEQFVFGRGTDYFLYWLTLECMIAVCGTLAIVTTRYWRRNKALAEQGAAPLPRAPSGHSEGAR